MVRAWIPIVAVLAFVGACTSPGRPDDPRACFLVDNSQGGDTAGRVVFESENGLRFRLGEVAMGRTLRECIQQSSFAGRWTLEIESASGEAGQVRRVSKGSEFLYLGAGDEITWNMRMDRLSVGRIGG